MCQKETKAHHRAPFTDSEMPHGGSSSTHPVDVGNASVIHTCDICPRVIFESEAALERHIDVRHKSMMESINSFLEKDTTAFDVSRDEKDIQALGKKAFEVATRRDAGPRMLQCASTARRQLQHIVDVWHPGAEVFIFGSSLVMSSWDGKSDIDFAVVDPKAYVEKRWPPEERNAVRELTELCKASGFRVSSLECVDSARVPIVKHKTLQDSLLNTIEQSDNAEEARRSIRVHYRSEKMNSSKDLREWLIKELNAGTIEKVNDDGEKHAIVVFNDSTSAMIAMLRINDGQKKRLNDLISARQKDEQFPPEAHCIDFDLCLRQFGIRNSEYLRKFHASHENSPFLRSGAVVLKEWSKLWGLNNSFMGFLTSYAINIMWIYFLVQRGVIPYVSPYDTPEDPKDALREPKYVPILPPDASEGATQFKMGSLLADFFRFYSTEFNWDKHVVSLNRPGITEKKSIAWTIENEIKLSRQSKNVRYVICIEDPYEPNLNLGRHLGVCKARKIKAEFRRAALSVKSDPIDECILFTSKYKKQVYVPMKEPPQDIFAEVQSVVHNSFNESPGSLFTPDSLRTMLIEHCPDAFKALSAYWNWKVLVRRLGLRQVGDQIHKRASFDFLSEKARGQPAFKVVPHTARPIAEAPLSASEGLGKAVQSTPEIVKASCLFSTHPTSTPVGLPSVTRTRSHQFGKMLNVFRLMRL